MRLHAHISVVQKAMQHLERKWKHADFLREIPELIDSFVYRGPIVPYFVSRVKFAVCHERGCRVLGMAAVLMYMHSLYQRCFGGAFGFVPPCQKNSL